MFWEVVFRMLLFFSRNKNLDLRRRITNHRNIYNNIKLSIILSNIYIFVGWGNIIKLEKECIAAAMQCVKHVSYISPEASWGNYDVGS